MAQDGAIDMLVALLECENHKVKRQAAKALANLGVNGACYTAVTACPHLLVFTSNLVYILSLHDAVMV